MSEKKVRDRHVPMDYAIVKPEDQRLVVKEGMVCASIDLTPATASQLIEQLREIEGVCEWTESARGWTTKCGNVTPSIDDDFKICPYCGKKVRVKG